MTATAMQYGSNRVPGRIFATAEMVTIATMHMANSTPNILSIIFVLYLNGDVKLLGHSLKEHLGVEVKITHNLCKHTRQSVMQSAVIVGVCCSESNIYILPLVCCCYCRAYHIISYL